MIRVDQETFNSFTGDCLRASIASLLEIPLHCIPHFLKLFPKNQKWFEELGEWLELYGYNLVGWFGTQGLKRHKGIKGHTLISVDTPHPDCMHACVYSNKEQKIVHDPDPRRLYENNDKVDILGFYYIESIEQGVS